MDRRRALTSHALLTFASAFALSAGGCGDDDPGQATTAGSSGGSTTTPTSTSLTTTITATDGTTTTMGTTTGMPTGGETGSTGDTTGCPDSDMDTVCDADDICDGEDDLMDTDMDGVPNGCDVCDMGPDMDDMDMDMVPDACDVCPGFDDNVDTDMDGTADGCDLCPGFDDNLDADMDGTPDDCDLCPGFDDNLDMDADGVPDGCDACEGFDDNLDADMDMVPDGCDICPGFDDNVDTDMDMVPDGCDVCPGVNDVDPFEDDDTAMTAGMFTVGTPVTGATICADDDFWSFDVQAGCRLDITATFIDANGDLDLELFDGMGNNIATAASGTDNEFLIRDPIPSDDTYILQVFGFMGDFNDYGLTIDLLNCPASCPGDDMFEDNDDQATASTLPVDTPAAGITCGGDEDWFATTTTQTCIFEADLQFTHANGDLDMGVFDSAGTQLATSGSSTDNEFISFVGVADAYATRVFGFGGAENNYTLTTSTRVCTAAACPADDGFEDNDTTATASPILSGGPLLATSCGSDDDWYSIPLAEGCTVDIDLRFFDATTDLDLELHDGLGVVGTSSSSSDNEFISYTVPVGNTGDHFILVEDFQGNGAPYSLEPIVTCPAFTCPADDNYEENDGLVASRPGVSGSNLAGQVCASDPDWYSVFAPAGCVITADLTFIDADGDLDLRLRDQTMTVLDQSTSTSDNESVSALATATAPYFFEIIGFGGSENNYDFTFNLTNCP